MASGGRYEPKWLSAIGQNAEAGAGVTEYLQNATIRYDEANRVSQVSDTRATIRYEYDAVGNRRRVWSYYNNGIDGAAQTQDNWYAYDGMNRFTVSMGRLSSSDGHRGSSATDSSVSITRGALGGDGIALSYDQAGQRRMIIAARDGHREDYAYSATGYLTDTWINSAGSATQGSLAARRSNDLLGRVTAYSEYAADGVQTSVRNTVLDADNRTLSVSGTDGSSTYAYYNGLVGGLLDDTNNVSSSGAGELARVTSSNAGTTTTTWTHYDYWDEAKQSAITISAYNPVLEENNALWKPGVSRLTYDANGHLASASDAGKDGVLGTGDDIRFQYIDNAQGLTLRRDQVYGNRVAMTHNYLYLDGKGIGDIGNDGDRHLDYAQSLAQVKQSKTETYKNWQPIASADFDQNYQPINGDNPGGASSRYTVKQGDTLQGIASAQWGDASLWYLLADANGLSGGIALKAGQVLTVPNKVTNVHNNSSTFRPYEAGRIIGNTSPTLPDAPPAPVHYSSSGGGGGGGCGGIGAILVAIVVVVVVIYTAGAAAELLGVAAESVGATSTFGVGSAVLGGAGGASGLAAAAIGGAVGSIAGQGLSMAMGMQKEFSWGAVAAGALGAAAMSGLGGLNGGEGLFGGNAVLNAAAGNIATQGINILTGQQKEFSWASLAASAIAAPIAQSISSSLTSEGGALASLASDKVSRALVSSTVAALVSATTRLVIQGGRLQWEAVAADALSGAVRGAFASDGGGSGSAATQQPKDELKQQEAAFRNGNVDTPAVGYDSPLDDLRQNGLSGGRLNAMGGSTPATRTAGSGDSWARIARETYGDERYAQALMQANGARSTHLREGAEVTLPDLSGADLKAGGRLIAADSSFRAAQRAMAEAANAEPVWSFKEASMALRTQQNAQAAWSASTGGAYLSAAPEPSMREQMLQGVRGALGDSNAAGVAVGFAKSYLYSADNLVSGITNAPGAVAGIASSLWNDPLGTVGSGVESLRTGYRTLMSDTAAGQEARGSLLFGIGATAATGGLGRGAVVEGGVSSGVANTTPLAYDISKWGEYGLPADGTFVRTLTPAQYRDLTSGRSFKFGGGAQPEYGYPNGMGFIGSAEEVRSINTVAGYREALKLDYDPKFVMEFQLRDSASLQNVIKAPWHEFVYGGKTGAGYSEWNYPGITSGDIVNPKVRVLK